MLPTGGKKTVPVIDNNPRFLVSPPLKVSFPSFWNFPEFVKLCVKRACEREKRIVKNNVRACSPLFSFTTSGLVSRCDVAPSPPPFFSFFFLVGDRPCCCTRAPPNRITARGKRNFRRNKLRGNTKNRHFADVGPLVIIKAFALPPLHNPFSTRSFPSTRNRVRPRCIAPLLWDRLVVGRSLL